MKRNLIIMLLFAILVLGFSNCRNQDTIALNASTVLTMPSCYNCNDGKIELTIIGGIPPYAVSWADGVKTEDRDSLTEGIYIFTIIDAEGSTLTDSVQVNFTHELVEIQTNYGNMLIWLYYQTPLHRANFLKLANDSFYDGLIFHRIIKDFVIQGGDPEGTGNGGPGYKIDAEFVPGITHVLGAVGAARDNNPAKQSNGSQFYIVDNVNGTHFLDNNYTVFGLVVDGISSVHTIAGLPKDSKDKPLTDVIMTKVLVKTYHTAELKTMFNFSIPK